MCSGLANLPEMTLWKEKSEAVLRRPRASLDLSGVCRGGRVASAPAPEVRDLLPAGD